MYSKMCSLMNTFFLIKIKTTFFVFLLLDITTFKSKKMLHFKENLVCQCEVFIYHIDILRVNCQNLNKFNRKYENYLQKLNNPFH